MSARSPSSMGIKLLKAVMHTHTRWCMHIEDHHDEYDNLHDHKHHTFGRRRSTAAKFRNEVHPEMKIRSASSLIKVVIWEGGAVKTYSRPIKVAEVTMEFPKHMVCRSDSLYIGQKIPPLSEHHLLQPGRTYFLLPSHLFHSALSFVTVASILSSNNILRRKGGGTASCQPFLVQKSASGCSRMRVSDEFIIAHLYDSDEEQLGLDDHNSYKHGKSLCTTPQLHKDYAQLVQSRRRTQWKPNLPTITEIACKTGRIRRKKPPAASNNSKGTHSRGRKIRIFKSTKSSSSHSCPP